MPCNQFGVDPGARDGVEDPVVSLGITTSKLCFANIGQAWAKLIAQEPKQSKHHITHPSGIGHDFQRSQSRPMFQKPIQDIHRIPEGARNDNGMEASKLVRSKIVIGDPAAPCVCIMVKHRFKA